MNIKHYVGKNILAWLAYRENYEDPYGGINNRCYVYPRVLLGTNSNELIDPKDFPQRGSIEIRIQGGDTAEDLYRDVGALVSVRINSEPSINYSANANNYYNLKYSYQHGRNASEIWIEPFSGKGFYQIVDVDRDIFDIQRDKNIPVPDMEPYTTRILLRYQNKIYGPFEFDIKENELYLHSCKDYQYMIGAYDAINYNDDLLIIVNDRDEEVVFLLPQTSLCSPTEDEITIDWISEEKLIDSFLVALKSKNSLTKEQKEQIKDYILQALENNSEIQFSEERVARIKNLLTNITQNGDSIQDIVGYSIENTELCKKLVQELVSQHFDLIRSKLPEYSKVQSEIEELEGKKAQLLELISELQEKKEKSETLPADYQEQLDGLQKENAELKRTSAELQSTIDEVGNIEKRLEELRAECEHYSAEREKEKEKYKQQVIENNELERQLRETLENFSDKAKQTAKILDNKLLERILRSIDGDAIDDANSYEFDSSLLYSAPMDYKEIVNRVASFVRDKAHRDSSNNDIANYLICISQGFITTFAGEPGTGKTSLCNILAKSLGLAGDTPNNRFIDVSVERGWSSHKDFIGYYNPLTKEMQKSNVEVYNAFEMMDREHNIPQSEIAPFVILLDEANLSPIEHYWAAFLRNCDFASVSNRSISLGGNKSFKLPEHLRFLATVNFDHTTEELSPRFLDRSWVIMLEPSRISDEADENIDNGLDMLSFASIKEAFSVREDDIIDEAILNKWSNIQKIFKDKTLQIMPRNLKMVKNYCAVACRCMEHDTPSTKFAPLDYAVSQKILPTINGTGDNYRELIDELIKECTAQSMPLTAKHLVRMKSIAENNMGFYQFFSK